MKCSKCGKEIKEGNVFCTYCGTLVNKVENNKDITSEETKEVKSTEDKNNINNKDSKTKKKSNKMKIIIPIIVAIIIIICIVVGIILKNKNNEETNANEVVEEQQQETAKIEIGTNYNCVEDGVTGYINFNTETSYVMNMTYDMSESVTYNGTYKIEGNTITLTVTYYDMVEDPSTFEPYTETITILEDGTLEYTSANGDKHIFDKNKTLPENTIDTTETTAGDLLEQIYAKYPNLEGTEGIICTDGIDYWLLDEIGDKVYFTDLNSFEEALEQCNIDVSSVGSSTTENTNSISTIENNIKSNSSSINNNSTSNSNKNVTYKYTFTASNAVLKENISSQPTMYWKGKCEKCGYIIHEDYISWTFDANGEFPQIHNETIYCPQCEKYIEAKIVCNRGHQ